MTAAAVLSGKKIAILGLGLMGGSLALALRDAGHHISALEINPETIRYAREAQIAAKISANPADILPEADLIILAAPVGVILRMIEQLPLWKTDEAVVIDLGSTKKEICGALAKLPPRFSAVGGHPMCGKAESGLVHAEAGLFKGSRFAFVDLPNASTESKKMAEALAEVTGSIPLWLDADTHDSWVAVTSHVPYLLANIMAGITPVAAAPLASSGWRSTTRLAGSSLTMMNDILNTNRKQVEAIVEQVGDQLTILKALLAAQNEDGLAAFLAEGAAQYQAVRTRGGERMDKIITPSRALKGHFSPTSDLVLPGDKSLSHRAALFAALAEGESRIENFLDSGVTKVMLQSLSDLGIQWQLAGKTLTVQGKGLAGFATPKEALYCGHSATTIRLMAGALAAAGIEVILDGSEGLRKRPMGRIVNPLQQLGVAVSASTENTAPLKLAARPAGQKLKGGVVNLQQASAQVKTCVLLAGLAAGEALTINEPGPSRDHSERMLSAMGAAIQVEGLSVTMQPLKQPLLPLNISLPGDLSAAAFLIVAALITPDSELTIEGVGLNPRRTGLLDVLIQMGAKLTYTITGETAGEPVGTVHAKTSVLSGTKVAGEMVVRMIDEFPIFAVAAAYARGDSIVQDAVELRYKESDRIQVLCKQLKKIGADVEEKPDGFIIHGRGSLPGGTVESSGDHRLAMSLAVAGLASEKGVTVQGADMVTQSFPAFFEMLNRMGAF